MATRLEDKKVDLLERVVDRLHDKLDDALAALAEAFVHHYYQGVPPADLIDRDPLDLYGAALAHLRFGQQRHPAQAKVRVYNPQIEQHGWQSTHTIVEVINDDMPFLVDSASMALNRLGLLIHLTIHPVVPVRRDAEGAIEAVLGAAKGDGGEATFESFMHLEVDRQSDLERLETIRAELERALGDVRAAVEDWRPILGKIEVALRDLETGAKAIDAEDLEEAKAFLAWIADHHFTFLGYGCYDLVRDRGGDQLRRVEGSALGLLRRQEAASATSRSFAALPPEIRRQARAPVPIMITKANARSTVHRPVYLDYIGVRRFDAAGKVVGEHRFLGLFTSAAYNRNPDRIPLLRHKVARVIGRAKLPATSHSGKALVNILDSYPRDELFQTDEEELFRVAKEILHLQDRQKIRLFLRRDPFARFVSCLVYVPRERYDTELRRRFQSILQEALGGTEVEWQVQVSESILARIHFIVRTPEGVPSAADPAELETRLAEAARSWTDRLSEALIDAHGEEEGNRLFDAYGAAMPAGYQEQVPARAAVPDIDRIDQLASGATDLAMSLYRSLEHGADLLCLKLVRKDHAIPLSDVLPVLENMGLRVIHEQPYEFVTARAGRFWMHDFRVQPVEAMALEIEQIRDAFQEAFARVWRGEVENDGFNQLVLHGLDWRQILVLRAYCKYLLQVGIPFSQAYMERTLAHNPTLARHAAELFEAKFDPDATYDRQAKLAELEARFRAGLDAVANLDEDRILRRYLRLILATLRTNYFQGGPGGAPHNPYLSFKIDPAAVPEMPLPLPACEIFVYSPRVEGVHLRGGKVARGGIRWSDRREDFRTEVLGLMKAQMVKNCVIVPVGAKGGFVVKRPPRGGDRAALQAEVVACYKTLIRGMLDLTDNRAGDRIVPPERVVRFDDADPYLVVAADKGTATFSDIANGISKDYDYWLDDAFASGGSVGYDHKGMGITARGAWESVKRHFLELGKDCQSAPFTAIGIGDMSGDVFGNGMLRSAQTRLIAAFDHRHIFIDPDPDPATSHAERQRLFALPRSSWDDYDRSQLSAGGGVWPRTLKSIEPSPQARRALAVDAEAFTPAELIRAILLAPVELFWNGGIGTYVKAASERHAEAFDRANDGVRVDAEQLRCRIVGEGGNLGFTQKARIAFAQNGGRINTDFVDNSAGVDCSDHEVNIKILLNAVVASGDMTEKQRNQLLAAMTDEVALLVLRNNILQVQAISLAEATPSQLLDAQTAFIRRLEGSGRLNRELEVLPDDETLDHRRQLGQGLFRPEVAVLIAYAKMTLYDELLASDLPDDRYLLDNLIKYFPRPLRKRFASQIAHHRLRREIIATLVANSLVNRGLGEFVGDLSERTGRSSASVARAYIVARDAFALVPSLGELELVAWQIGAERQIALLGAARRALGRGTDWFLRNLPAPIDIRAAVDRFATGTSELLGNLDKVLTESDRLASGRAVDEHLSQGMGADVARRCAALPYLFPACEVVAVADKVGSDVVAAGSVYFAIDARLHLGRLRHRLEQTTPRSHWERSALAGLHEDLVAQHRRLTIEAFGSGRVQPEVAGDGAGIEERVAAWLDASVAGFARWQRLLAELERQPSADLAMLSVAVRSLNQLGDSESPRAA
ncbi:MAG: NAD-glutamate dehydrogenase [Geminicoccaceae bacterium]